MGAEVGEWGHCEQESPQCYVGDGSCGSGYVCLGIFSNASGEPGVCKPTPKRECQTTQFLCEDVCCEQATEVCNEGSCVVPCEKGGIWCDNGRICYSNNCETPANVPCEGGGVWCGGGKICHNGHCEEPASILCVNGGALCTGVDEICVRSKCEPKPPPGECEGKADDIACDNGNGFCYQDDCEQLLSNFQLLVNSQAKVPLRAHGAAGDDVNADWVGGPGLAQIRVTAKGPEAATGLYVQTSLGALNTAACSTQCTGDSCEWTCPLPAGWSGSVPETQVQVGIGLVAVQVWTYKVSLLPPALDIVAPQTGTLGETLTVCVTATTTQAPLDSFSASLQVLDGVTPLSLSWTENTLSGAQKCWTTLLPLTLTWSGAAPLQATWTVSAEAVDIVGNIGTENHNEPLVLTRLVCNTTVGNTVVSPLVFVSGRLAFAASASLYFFDVDKCAMVPGTPLQIAGMRSPMVAMDDGTLAVATLSTQGPAELRNRLFMVDAAAEYPNFIEYPGTPTVKPECVIGSAGTSAAAQFDRGLSLLSLGPVRYAAPANGGTNPVLVTYTPSEMSETSRCIGTALPTISSIVLPLAQTQASEMVAVHEDVLLTWRFNSAIPQWVAGSWTSPHDMVLDMDARWGIALNGGNIWLSFATGQHLPMLQLWQSWAALPNNLLTASIMRVSPAAIDSQGRAYVLGYEVPGGSGAVYELIRLSVDGSTVEKTVLPIGSTGDIVGSPLLGEAIPGGSPEVYVVRANGRVFAFDADTLAQLWMVDLGFTVPAVAQPVLAGNTLWVVGTGGQVRGLRVASDGLNRSAAWPKAFHDNCNTSSELITPLNMLSCFK
ncbi:MAG: PQQ-like beta-propeller repeat protein [Proteobacteria bacterium]|nr:PQQ-like beta-propeller repeat protein [Cystobacterineae bacterium]MCL2258894.1 PQQ-like beta-propeller repeat protein [Cystobacterineae bacterium]MCL2314745.1 PQQ-like beta-propeller repeat protein [Pseudomonadota bacterium]